MLANCFRLQFLKLNRIFAVVIHAILRKTKLLKALILKSFFKKIVSAYIWLSAGGTFLFAALFGIVAFNIFPAAKINFLYKRILRFVFWLAFVRVKVHNKPEIQKGQAYLYFANHTSIADVPLMGAYLPTFSNAVEAQSHWSWPIYKHLIKAYGQIPINRKNVRASYKSMSIALERLKNGKSIIIFPEGHRTRTGKMQAFKKLPFSIAKKSGAVIIPISVCGMWKLSPGDGFEKNPATINMYFHKPLRPEDYQELSPEQLQEKVFEMISSKVENKA